VGQPSAFSDVSRELELFSDGVEVIDDSNIHHPIHAGDWACSKFVIDLRTLSNESEFGQNVCTAAGVRGEYNIGGNSASANPALGSRDLGVITRPVGTK
jgi:hypothetical protein